MKLEINSNDVFIWQLLFDIKLKKNDDAADWNNLDTKDSAYSYFEHHFSSQMKLNVDSNLKWWIDLLISTEE